MSEDPKQISAEFNRKVEQVRGYADLTDEAKARRIAEAYEDARERYEAAVAEQRREVEARVEKTERAVFGPPYPFAATDVEQAQLRALHRSAYDSVQGALMFSEGPGEADEEMENLLARAERTGDAELARAVYLTATERGARKIAEAYLDKRPDEKKRWEAYVQARQEAEINPLDVLREGPGGIVKPQEIQGVPGGALAG